MKIELVRINKGLNIAEEKISELEHKTIYPNWNNSKWSIKRKKNF